MARSGFDPAKRARVLAQFRALAEEPRRRVSDAVEQNASELAEAIRARVPTDTGDLAESVGYRMGKGKDFADADISATVFEGKRGTFYAPFVEFGTSTGARAQPHFFPTYRARKRLMKRRLNKAMKDAIREATS